MTLLRELAYGEFLQEKRDFYWATTQIRFLKKSLILLIKNYSKNIY
jgi:hypothetical protein